MTQNHTDIRKTVFESSVFLTDILARCAFIEKEHYRNNHSETKDTMENALKQVYINILQYAAQVQQTKQASGGKKILGSLSPVTNHPLKQIESAMKANEEKLHQWVRYNEHLQHQETAEYMLPQIDESVRLMKGLHQKIDLSRLPTAEEASFDSHVNQHEDECLPGTRKQLLQQIQRWGNSSEGPCIFWLNGMAGTGKSTISRTVSKIFKEKGQLGASFFFKRGGGDRGNANRFFSTITRQLVIKIPDLAPGVSKAIEDDPDIASRLFKDQFNKLLLQPLCCLNHDQTTEIIVIVIDALDECDGEKDIQLLLQLFSQIRGPSSVQLRVFVTSRPELPIRLGFQGGEIKDIH